MSSKIIGMENEFFSQMVVDAILSVKSTDDFGNVTCARRCPRC
jgi:chaperonin GroEL (HSP60 family)